MNNSKDDNMGKRGKVNSVMKSEDFNVFVYFLSFVFFIEINV